MYPASGYRVVWALCQELGVRFGIRAHLSVDLIKVLLYYDYMDQFSALADPTRRKILELLARDGPLSAAEICDHFQVSAPAISQHLKILRETDLVSMEKRAQQHIYQVNPQAVLEIADWAGQMTQLWSQRFDVLEQVLEAEKISLMERSSQMTNPVGRELSLTRVFDAPRELVFKAWTEPAMVARWWGPHGFTNPVCEMDVRPGGALVIHMRGPDGVVYPGRGVFREVVPPQRLVFMLTAIENEAGQAQLETLNTITFEEMANKTKLTLQVVVITATPAADGPLSGMEAGWTQSLERLGAALGTTQESTHV
jgi:uncharacterized protein YndB with AHSA1/START domain/DNA-binding transcriptional ArsR family regulator